MFKIDQIPLFSKHFAFYHAVLILTLIGFVLTQDDAQKQGQPGDENSKWVNTVDDSLDMLRIPQGQLRGKRMLSRDGRKYYRFSSIPYAQPPQRFEPPEPALPWNGTLDATKVSEMCAQVSIKDPNAIVGSENCLMATIHVSDDVLRRRSTLGPRAPLLPVLVFVHPGSYLVRSDEYYGTEHLMDQEILVATFNYRLDSLGFFTTGDGEILANNGLKDALMAFEWIQANIRHFGGHPGRITAMGQSSGAATIQTLMLSPRAEGLFSRAVLDSGSVLQPYALMHNPIGTMKQFAQFLNCPTTNSLEMATCVKSKDLKDLVVHHSKWSTSPISPFAPTVEIPVKMNGGMVPGRHVLLTEHPLKLLMEGRAVRVPVMMTIMKDEGLAYSLGLLKREDQLKGLNENWNQMAPSLLDFAQLNLTQSANDIISQRVRDFYFPPKSGSGSGTTMENPKVSEETIQQLTDMLSDRYFVHGTLKSALLLAPHMPVYPLHFSYQGNMTYLTVLGLKNFGNPVGVAHNDQVQYLFKLEYQPDHEKGSEAENFSRIYVRLLTSFIYEGVPRSPRPWHPISLEEAQMGSVTRVYDLNGVHGGHMIKSPFFHRLRFWDDLTRMTGLIEETRFLPNRIH